MAIQCRRSIIQAKTWELKMEAYMKLSTEAMGSLLMALQKCLIEQSDITDILKGLKFKEQGGMLFVMNPPVFKVNYNDSEPEEEADA